MAGSRISDKLSFKILWIVVGVLGSLCIFFLKDWFTNTNSSSQLCADEIRAVDKRVIVLETIIPEIKNFMEKLDKKIDQIDKKN